MDDKKQMLLKELETTIASAAIKKTATKILGLLSGYIKMVAEDCEGIGLAALSDWCVRVCLMYGLELDEINPLDNSVLGITEGIYDY